MLRALNELFLQFNARRYASDVFFTAKYQELAVLFQRRPNAARPTRSSARWTRPTLSSYDALVNRR